MASLKVKTVKPLLYNTLKDLMKCDLFLPFRLVGGTNLSLREGHRISDDIDLFSDYDYDSLDFSLFEDYLKNRFDYYDRPDKTDIVGFGRSYYIGDDKDNCIKLDLYYTDTFISPLEEIEGIRFAGLQDIIAMKLEAIGNGGRKKDFWDIHYLLERYEIKDMLDFYIKRYPYNWQKEEVLQKMVDFHEADEDFEPKCLLNKDWDIIKLDIIEKVKPHLQI